MDTNSDKIARRIATEHAPLLRDRLRKMEQALRTGREVPSKLLKEVVAETGQILFLASKSTPSDFHLADICNHIESLSAIKDEFQEKVVPLFFHEKFTYRQEGIYFEDISVAMPLRDVFHFALKAADIAVGVWQAKEESKEEFVTESPNKSSSFCIVSSGNYSDETTPHDDISSCSFGQPAEKLNAETVLSLWRYTDDNIEKEFFSKMKATPSVAMDFSGSENELKRKQFLVGFGELLFVGEGGQGKVYQVKSRPNRALKEISLLSVRNKEIRQKLQREAPLLKQLKHKNILQISDVEVIKDSYIFLEMEYCGYNLRQKIVAQREKKEVPFDEEIEIKPWFKQLVAAVQHLHEKSVIHRDIKPGNILFADERCETVKLGDFGLSRLSPLNPVSDLSETTDIINAVLRVGTLPYMAPEILLGQKADFSSDIWSLGIVLYQLATLERPFNGRDGVELSAKIATGQPEKPISSLKCSESIKKLVEQLLRLNPQDRPSVDIVSQFQWSKAETRECNRNMPILSEDSTAENDEPLLRTANIENRLRKSSNDTGSDSSRRITKVKDVVNWGIMRILCLLLYTIAIQFVIDLIPLRQLFFSVFPVDNGVRTANTQPPIHMEKLSFEWVAYGYFLPPPGLITNDKVISVILRAAADKGRLELVKMLVEQYCANVAAKSINDGLETTPFHLASSSGHLQVVDYLLQIQPNLIDVKDSEGNRPIHVAALWGRIDVVDYFLSKRGVNVEIRQDRLGRTPLHKACEGGHLRIVKLLVKTYKADMFAQSSAEDSGKMPIHVAASSGHLSIVTYLTTMQPALVEAKDSKGNQPIHLAALRGKVKVVHYFTQTKGVDVELRQDFFGRTPLHLAACEGHIELVKLLVEQYKADTNAKSSPRDYEYSAIHYAAYFGRLAVVQYLLAQQPNLIDAKDIEGIHPIHMAALGDRLDVVEYFLSKAGVSVEVRDDMLGRAPLHLAAAKGHLDMVKLLVEKYKASANAKSFSKDYSYSPIHLAAYFGHLPVVEYFLQHQPDLMDAKDIEGNRPIHMAALGGRTDVVAYFVSKAGMSSEVREHAFGRTPLHLAAAKGHLGLVRLLVEKYHANVFATSIEGLAGFPIHLASSFGHSAVVDYFRAIEPTLISGLGNGGDLPTRSLRGPVDIADFSFRQRVITRQVLSEPSRTTTTISLKLDPLQVP